MPSISSIERVVETTDAEATRALAARLAAVARPGDLLCLIGDLGAGKTQFAKGFAVGLGIDGHGQLADVRADDRVRRAAADVPRRSVPARRRRRRARRRPARRAPAGRRRARRMGRSGSGPRCRAARLDVVIDGTGDDPRRIAIRAGDEAYRRYVEAAA